MPSAEHGRTLTHRLARTLALVTTLGATIALAAALLTADVLIRRHVERSARHAAHVMAVELDENPRLVAEVAEEADELGIDGRVAVVRGTTVVTGDPALEGVSVDGCAVIDAPLDGELVCREPLHASEGLAVLVAVSRERVVGHRLPLLLAGLAGLVVVVAGAALSGRAIARRFMIPLARLRRAVADVDASAPAAVELPPRTGLEEIDALHAALTSLLARLDAELTRARRFAAHAAHELRTPLARMLTELELAVEVAGSEADAAVLTKVQRSTERLIRLGERLLLLATPTEALATEQATSLSQLAEDLCTQRPAEEAARLRVEADASDCLVRGDAVLLGMLLDNVVDNALKFSSGPVHVCVKAAGDEVVLAVSDEGPGVPADRTALFEPFRRGAATAHLPGHGLGLALVAHIARAYGGTARFADARARGACLEVRLPAVLGREDDAA